VQQSHKPPLSRRCFNPLLKWHATPLPELETFLTALLLQ